MTTHLIPYDPDQNPKEILDAAIKKRSDQHAIVLCPRSLIHRFTRAQGSGFPILGNISADVKCKRWD